MRSLSLLVLLLFAVVVHTVASSSPATPTLMEELLANGTRWRFKSFNGLYLTFDYSSKYYWALPRQDWLQDWTFERFVNNEDAAIRSNGGYYIGHGTSDYAKGAKVAYRWEKITPVKNSDGSWSFRSRFNKWLSAHTKYEDQRYFVNFENANSKCEKWFLEPYTPPANPFMEELLANGAPRRFKSFNGLYLTDDPSSEYFLTQRQQDWGRLQKWTIVQINDHEVAIKSNNNYYIGHGTSDWAKEARAADDWEMLTPVKNADDGTWSFKSRYDKWLSGHYYDGPERYYLSFEPKNSKCERWKLEPYTPPAKTTLMEELVADGAPRALKAYDGRFLLEEHYSSGTYLYARPNAMQEWSIEQVNENEVAIKARDGRYLQHGAHLSGRADMSSDRYANSWEMLTPVKNVDGSWSFKSRWNKWLSAHHDSQIVYFQPENKRCEHWKLEPYYS